MLDIVLEAGARKMGSRRGRWRSTGIPTDYQFLMALSQRIDAAKDEEDRADMMALRSFLLEIQEQVQVQQQQAQAEMAEEAQAVLQEVLQSTDTAAVLREHADAVDEVFLSLLAANIRAAEQKGATAAARRLSQVYKQAIEIAQERMPADMRLLNQLLSAPDDATARQLLRDNRSLQTVTLMDNMKALEEDMRKNGRRDCRLMKHARPDRLDDLMGRAGGARA